MPNAKKKGELSKTTQSYVQEWMKEQIYGARRFSGNKFTEKGHEVEDDSIAYVEKVLGLDFILKNEEHFTNDFLTGTPDVIMDDLIIDVKNSWDMWTFPLFEEELPNKDYYYQAQGYMALTGKKHYKVIYTLMNTPEELLNPYQDVEYDYNDLDSKYRLKVFDIERDDEVIQKIYDRVEEIRKYIKELEKSL